MDKQSQNDNIDLDLKNWIKDVKEESLGARKLRLIGSGNSSVESTVENFTTACSAIVNLVVK